ncbi:MAG: hypothetical protein AAGK05_07465, partial [Pseudomonadota bacterium]
FSRIFEKIQAYLKSGDCYQINLAQRFKAEFSRIFRCSWLCSYLTASRFVARTLHLLAFRLGAAGIALSD